MKGHRYSLRWARESTPEVSTAIATYVLKWSAGTYLTPFCNQLRAQVNPAEKFVALVDEIKGYGGRWELNGNVWVPIC